MKLRCIKINPESAKLFKGYYKVGQVYEAKRDSSLDVIDVKDDGEKGLSWCVIQKESKFTLNIYSLEAVTFELCKGPRRLVVTEKKVDRISDKRRHRRLCRQYGKLRFTEPGMFCFIAFAAMKKNARNHKR